MSRNIVRVNKTKNYTVMSNTHLNDTRLSWKAKGIHSYVLSLPDDWKIILTHLKTMATDGEKSMRSGLKELYDLYYWQRYAIYVDGIIDKWVTEIYEEPFPAKDKIKNIIIKNGVETIYYELSSKETSLLGGKVKVGMIEEGIVNIEKDKLLSTNTTKDLSITNHSSITDDGLTEFKNILDKLDLHTFKESKAIEQSIRILYYSDKPLKLNNMNIPQNQVREDLKRLTSSSIESALSDFENASREQTIKNVTSYLSRCIYNSIFDDELKIDASLRYNKII